MPPFLSKLVEDLKQIGRNSTKQQRIKRPPVAAHNTQCYGYAVSSEWLMRFSEQHRDLDCLEELPDRDHIDYEDVAMVRARELLASWSGIYFLDYRKCHDPPDGIIPPEWIAAFNSVYSEEPDDTLDAIELVTVQASYAATAQLLDKVDRTPTAVCQITPESTFEQKDVPSGTITDVKFLLKQDGISRRFGFVGFRTDQQAGRDWFDRTIIDSTRINVTGTKDAPTLNQIREDAWRIPLLTQDHHHQKPDKNGKTSASAPST
ncbi:hypothetical protein BDR04DRAFT_1163157 [Suillus decipiens]|nr:hypothetical protein BDR04DRAFT_1163157 [Suillus decipiens]